jgi:hypothetical protein
MEQQKLVEAIDTGLTQRQLADHFDCSQTTIRYWLGRYTLKTKTLRHNRKPYEGKYVERVCKNHGLTTFIYEPSKKAYRCKMCRSGNVSKQRRDLQTRLVQEAGGHCVRCGYSKSYWSLHFHHRDPTTKTTNVSLMVRDRNYERAKGEAEKCDLVCANCHGEMEEAKYLATVV